MGAFDRVWAQLPRPLRESQAPHLRALARSMVRGTQLLGLTSAVRGAYLDTARGRWLDVWADAFSVTRRPGEADAAFRSRLMELALTRGDTRREAVQAQVSAEVGVPVGVVGSAQFVAHYDRLEDYLERGQFMADFERISRIVEDQDGRWGVDPWGATPWGEEAAETTYVFDDTPFNHLGYAGRTPLRPGWGPKGAVLTLGEQYDPALEDAAIESAARNLPAATGYDLFWSHTFRNRLEGDLVIVGADGFTYNESGWGVDSWGGSTWG